MATGGVGANVRLTGTSNVWFDDNQPSDIHLTVNDEHLAHPLSGKDSLHLVVSSNPRSANFDPKSFNTLRALLAHFGKPHPVAEANEAIPRRFDRRRAHLD
jgi:hypothetical protein